MRYRRAFTLIELLIVIAILGVLIGLLMPTVSNARESARRVQCAANLRNIGAAMIAYGADNDKKVPMHSNGAQAGNNWMWDIPRPTRDALLKNGMTRKAFYCPNVERESDDAVWDFNGTGGWTVVGYWILTQRIGGPLSLSTTELRELDPKKAYKKKFRTAFDQARAGELELATDVTMSTGGPGNRKFTGIPSTANLTYHQASHRNARQVAAGGNILFMDGRVEWRHWREPPTGAGAVIPDDQMQIRYNPGNHDQWF